MVCLGIQGHQNGLWESPINQGGRANFVTNRKKGVSNGLADHHLPCNGYYIDIDATVTLQIRLVDYFAKRCRVCLEETIVNWNLPIRCVTTQNSCKATILVHLKIKKIERRGANVVRRKAKISSRASHQSLPPKYVSASTWRCQKHPRLIVMSLQEPQQRVHLTGQSQHFDHHLTVNLNAIWASDAWVRLMRFRSTTSMCKAQKFGAKNWTCPATMFPKTSFVAIKTENVKQKKKKLVTLTRSFHSYPRSLLQAIILDPSLPYMDTGNPRRAAQGKD